MTLDECNKGTRVRLLSTGWEAIVMDNRRGPTRELRVFGDAVEQGEVYSHQVGEALIDGTWTHLQLTPEMIETKEVAEALGL